MKTLLALLLLIPSLSWGFFGKKYNCEPADDEFFYMSNYVESLGPHILKISGSKDKLTINFSDGNTDEFNLIQNNDDVLIYLYDQDIQIIIFFDHIILSNLRIFESKIELPSWTPPGLVVIGKY